jgi:hypothetical protein
MTTIFEKVYAALNGITPAVAFGQDTYLSTGELPDQYLVYSLVTSPPEQHANNAETERSYRIQVSIYSRTGLVTIPNVDAAMVAAGFIKGPWRNLPYDPDTGHFGLAKDYIYQLSN